MLKQLIKLNYSMDQMIQKDSFFAGHTSYFFLYIIPKLGHPFFMYRLLSEFFLILVYLLVSLFQLVCYEKIWVFWFKLMTVGHLSLQDWREFFITCGEVSLLTFLFWQYQWMLHIVKIALYNVLWFYHIYFPSLRVFICSLLTVYATK